MLFVKQNRMIGVLEALLAVPTHQLHCVIFPYLHTNKIKIYAATITELNAR